MTEAAGAAVAPDLVQQLADFIRRAAVEGTAILPELRAFFDQHADVWRSFGDLSRRAEVALADLAAGGDPVGKESILRHVEALKVDLADPGAPPLLRLLAANVAVSWLGAAEAEVTAANGRAAPTPRADFLDRRRHRARKRLEGALKTMAIVSKLLMPSPSPIEIATGRGPARFNARPPSAAGRNVPAARGVATAN